MASRFPPQCDERTKLRWTWRRTCRRQRFNGASFGSRVEVERHWDRRAISGCGAGQPADRGRFTTLIYTGTWVSEIGNYSGGSIQSTTAPGSAVSAPMFQRFAHTLYLGTRSLTSGGQVTVQVDGGTPIIINLALAVKTCSCECRWGSKPCPLNTTSPLPTRERQALRYTSTFLEIAVHQQSADVYRDAQNSGGGRTGIRTHSLALAPERTAWLVDTLDWGAD